MPLHALLRPSSEPRWRLLVRARCRQVRSGSYPGDHRGVSGRRCEPQQREQGQEQEQERDAARASHRALGRARRLGRPGPWAGRARHGAAHGSGRARRRLREPGAVIKASPAVTHAGARPAARTGARRGHTPHAPRAHARPPPAAPSHARAAPRLTPAPSRQRPPRGALCQAILPAAARRSFPRAPQSRFCGLGVTPLLSWFPKLHVLAAHNLQIICSADVGRAYYVPSAAGTWDTGEGEVVSRDSPKYVRLCTATQSTHCMPYPATALSSWWDN